MIMITRRKDYYDYLTGVYGRDEKKVFNRVDDVVSDEIYFESIGRWQHVNIFDILICTRVYRVEQTSKGVWELHKFHSANTDYKGNPRHYRESQVEGLDGYVYYLPVKQKDTKGNPISIKGVYHKDYKLEDLTPILSTFGIPAVMDANTLYSELDMYLGVLMSEKEKTKAQDDKNKLLAKGFDDKISFRHRK